MRHLDEPRLIRLESGQRIFYSTILARHRLIDWNVLSPEKIDQNN